MAEQNARDARDTVSPINPDAVPRKAWVLVEQQPAGDGKWHQLGMAQLIHASRGVIRVHAAAGYWVVPPQRAVWMPPNTPHRVGSSWGYRLQTLYLEPRTQGLPKRPAVVPVTPLLEQLLAATAQLTTEGPLRGAAERLVRVLLDHLPTQLHECELAQLHLPEPTDPRLRRMTQAIHDDPADPRDLATLAADVGLSMRSALRGFLLETGLTPGDWRRQRRMLAAVELLAQGHSVTQVALEVGYQESSSFIAVFRRAFGQTPARWAEALAPGARAAPRGARR
ncbi:MAG: AraC family transcriptional regulator [Curvibacter sp.]